jgi:hypothetical protein
MAAQPEGNGSSARREPSPTISEQIALIGRKPVDAARGSGATQAIDGKPHGRAESRASSRSWPVLYVRRACSTAWRCKSSPNLMEVKGSKPQGRCREAMSGGSGEQTHEPRDTNRIKGVSAGRASVRSQSPSPSRARSVNPAVACGQRSNLSREICVVSRWSETDGGVSHRDRGAGVSRGRSRQVAEGPNGKQG